MSFNSFPFIFLFLPVVAAGYFLCGRIAGGKWSKVWLLAAAKISDLPLLLGSLTVNCVIGRMLLKSKPEAASSRRRLLIFGISANILFLCWYKYAAFFVQIFNHVAGTKIHEPRLAFPLGISFFTIYQIMFLVDCYEELVEGHSWLDHFTFGSFFPYVTMGPIVRWKQIVPQFNQQDAYRPNADNI